MKQKKSCLGINARNVDRISSLPDCILHHILSFLDTNFAVQTAILSKRWQNVFETTPYLNFSYDFPGSDDPNVMPTEIFHELYDRTKDGFSECISRVLHAQNGYNCKKIVIRCDLILDSAFVKSVLEFAVKHKVQEIEIMADSDEQECYEFPESIYSCQSLEKLKLVGDQRGFMYVSKSMGFQYLKELRLHRLCFSSRRFNADVFSHCPSLELLSLVACILGSALELDVPRLKTLEVIAEFYNRPCYIKARAPMLSYVKYEGPDPMDFYVGECPLLEEIDIDIQRDISKVDIRKWFIKRLIRMLGDFQNAKSLTISLNTLQILSAIPDLLKGEESPIANLKNIQLKMSWLELVPGVSFLLKNSPNVKALIQGDLNKVDISKL